MNFTFANINKSTIPTGLLWDYGIDFAKLDNFNGSTLHDTNVLCKISEIIWQKSFY
jgi:hypothetical protein